MPEETITPAATEPAASTPPGWIAGLPDDLKANETFTKFKTVGEFAKDDLELRTKYSEVEKKLSNSVPKLPDDASDEERGLYFDALGRPKQPSDYKLQGEDKNAPEWTNFWKPVFHSAGLTQSQVDVVQGKFNEMTQKMVEKHNESIKNEIAVQTQKFKSELGDKFDTQVELAKRMWSKYGEGDFDKAFSAETSVSRVPIMRMILKFAAMTGEDRSPQGGHSHSTPKPNSFISYDKSPAPPVRN